MKRPRVLLDCDGVLSAFVDAALEIVHKVAGDRYVPVDVTRFDFCDALGLWGTPHNTGEPTPAGAHRMTSWRALASMVRSIAKLQQELLPP